MTVFAVTGSKLQSAPQLSPGRGRMLVTAFRSPATAAAFTASIPGSTFLACYFASLPIASAARSAFGSATDPGLLRDRPLQRFRPVAASSTNSICRFPGLHSPSGLLHPSGSKRSAGSAANQPAFRFRPISVRSPPPVSITSYGCGSTFPVRYVFGGLLFLKPLGTFLNMLPIAFCVNIFCGFLSFPQLYCALFYIGWQRDGVNYVDKTRRVRPVCDTDGVRRLDHPAGRDRRFYRVAAGVGTHAA